MKIIQYTSAGLKDITIGYLKEKIYQIEKQRMAKVETVIMSEDLFVLLRDEARGDGNIIGSFWYQKNGFQKGIRIYHYRIISSIELDGEVLVTFEI